VKTLVRSACVALTVLTVTPAIAVEVSGVISASTVWTKEGSPYIVVDTTSVATGARLTIEPGVDVVFNRDVPFRVGGTMRAIGTAEDSIRFMGGTTHWAGIVLTGSDTTKLHYVRVSDTRAEVGQMNGGAIRLTGGKTCVEIVHAVLTRNVANRWGGGLSAEGTTRVLLRHVTIKGDSALQYGAGAIYIASNAAVTADSCALVDNQSKRYGGAVYLTGRATLTMSNSTITGNTAGNNGGGIHLGHLAKVTLLNTTVSGNATSYAGGGLSATDSSIVEVTASTFTENVATREGGALCQYKWANLTLTDSWVRNNTAGTIGGAISAADTTMTTVTNTHVVGNRANKNGGACSLAANARAVLTSCAVDSNVSGADGGALSLANTAMAALVRTQVARNSAVGHGGAFMVADGATLGLVNCTVVDNSATSGNGGAVAKGGAAAATVSMLNTIIWGNQPQDIFTSADPADTLIARYCIIRSERIFPGPGNLNIYPMFVDTLQSDYRLATGSPAIDAADPMTPRDPDGSLADIGAYPYERPNAIAPRQEHLAAFVLEQNTPNPFNPVTTIRFVLPAAGHVRLMVYTMNGQLVRSLIDGDLGPGTHEIVWDGTDARGRPVASGVYVYRLEHIANVSRAQARQPNVSVHRMTLVR